MRWNVQSLLSMAVCVSLLAGCGGSNTPAENPAATQAKQLGRSDKSVSSPYTEVVEQLYVAYFGRPADPGGLASFEAQLAAINAPTTIQGLLAAYPTNTTVKALVDSFGNSSESQKLYGNSDPTAFVQAVFQNVLGRAPQTAGLNFWVGQLTSGVDTYGDAALAIMDGALTNTSTQGLLDQQLVINRIAVATEFTAEVTAQNAVSDYVGATAAGTARVMLSGVSASTDPTAFQSTVDTTVTSLVTTGPPPVNNTVAITVDAGADPSNILSIDAPFTSVTICAPSNPSLCQTIDHVLVDTGSYGLRLIYSTLTPAMASALSAQTSDNTLVECTTFVDGYTWGPMRQVNFQIAGETVSNLNLQVIGDPAFAIVPNDCQSTGPGENTVDTFGSNGVIGVGLFAQDCPDCVLEHVGAYYNCNTLGCTDSLASLAQQATNPVALFAADNNGVIISLPAQPTTGAVASTSGTMTFGINTQSDNSLGSASVFQMDQNADFTTIYAGKTMPNSFIDSGSNGLYFPNVTNIATCQDGFFCPPSLLSLSATMQATSSTTGNVNSQSISFTIGNVDTALNSVQTENDAVYLPLGAPNSDQTSFDWGLPFFFGRNVYVVIDGKQVGGQVGPFVAF